MTKTVQIGCSLPHGLTLFLDGKSLDFAGYHKSPIIGATYGITELDLSMWKRIKNAYQGLKCIWVVGDDEPVTACQELEPEKYGVKGV